MNMADSEAARSVLGSTRNKEKISSPSSVWKPVSKPSRKVDVPEEIVVEDDNDDKEPLLSFTAVMTLTSPPLGSMSVPSILRGSLLHSKLSLGASCSSDASSDSFHSRASTGRICRTTSTSIRRKQLPSKTEAASDGVSELLDASQAKKRCGWITPSTDPSYATFHDEEWGIPVHQDKKLFELLVLSGALAELTWPAILSKRQILREVFADFDPISVAKFNEKKITAAGCTGSSLLSEVKLRAIIENARQISKIWLEQVIEEFGSFDKYIWSFVNYIPMVSKFRYPRQVPVKTPKADLISKDLVRRGFRSVGPTVIYSFMQVAGMTNDHLMSCFRFHECISAAVEQKDELMVKGDEEKSGEVTESELHRHDEICLAFG